MNRGGLGAGSLNIELQQALKPAGELCVERYGSTCGVGDNAMQVGKDCDCLTRLERRDGAAWRIPKRPLGE